MGRRCRKRCAAQPQAEPELGLASHRAEQRLRTSQGMAESDSRPAVTESQKGRPGDMISELLPTLNVPPTPPPPDYAFGSQHQFSMHTRLHTGSMLDMCILLSMYLASLPEPVVSSTPFEGVWECGYTNMRAFHTFQP